MRYMKLAMMAIVLASTGVMGACENECTDEVEVSKASFSLLSWRPKHVVTAVSLSGRGLNGTSLTGKVLDGHVVIAVSLEDVQLSRGAAKDLKLDKTIFKGTYSPGKAPDDQEIIGAVFSAFLDDGDEIPLKVDALEKSIGAAGSYLKYAVSYPADGTWLPLCGTDSAGQPILAIPLSGVWNYESGVVGGGSHVSSDSAFTFACDGHVLAKCVEIGYEPWAEGWICPEEGRGRSGCIKTTLEEHHQACTRLLRADYCGDGTSYTVDGVVLHVYDGIGIRQDADDWILEAEWTPAGARCVSRLRHEGMGDVPPCVSGLLLETCGDPAHLESATTLMSEIQPTEP